MVYRIPSFTFPPGMMRRGGMPGNFQRFAPYGGFRYSTPTLGDFGRYSSAGPSGPAPTMARAPRLGGMGMGIGPAGTGPGMRGGYMGRNYGGMPGAGGPAYRGAPLPRGLLGMPFGGRMGGYGGYGGGFPGFAGMNPMARFYPAISTPQAGPAIGPRWQHLQAGRAAAAPPPPPINLRWDRIEGRTGGGARGGRGRSTGGGGRSRGAGPERGPH